MVEQENMSLGIAAFITLILYLWVAYLNGILFDAVSLLSESNLYLNFYRNFYHHQNERLMNKVTDIPWYDLIPKDRELLLAIIMQLQHPLQLQGRGISGLKHITYESLGESVKVVHGYCLVIQKILKG